MQAGFQQVYLIKALSLLEEEFFLLYKSVTEIHHKLEGVDEDHSKDHGKNRPYSLL